ncbi:gluconate 2-dehydrogenase subunit 3 family protein [Deinococcus radiotolerans]|uniref:Gluconate 2-dehydrogenase subunit 3 family protein n=1 Tax=Deinococcus radiotolerans TaxID=1309407 RepID=A0ABQ2FHP5_9DEIO|nr:gluconate 2-dehydrogenase subunit 3 family protein [Deinococcus radiotolerans]GGK99601.1 hypothetical protein GCM10010844_17350 [Deinococcus radiotolerans]
MSTDDRAAVEAALRGPAVTPPTRAALLARLNARYDRQYFTPAEFGQLRAAAVRLVPHDPAELDLAGLVDDRLHAGRTDGWRYADSLPDGDAYRALLAALPADFATLAPGAQDEALRAVQTRLPRAFEDLLAELVEGFVSHPLTSYRFGYAGFMDAPGWPQVGPNELEDREAQYGR